MNTNLFATPRFQNKIDTKNYVLPHKYPNNSKEYLHSPQKNSSKSSTYIDDVFFKYEKTIRPFIDNSDIDDINMFLRFDYPLPSDLQKKFNYLTSLFAPTREDAMLYRGVNRELYEEFCEGDIINIDKGLQFCSKNINEAIEYGQKSNKQIALLHIACPKGTNILKGDKFGFPSYIVLNSNQKFVLKEKKEDKDGILHVFLTCVA